MPWGRKETSSGLKDITPSGVSERRRDAVNGGLSEKMPKRRKPFPGPWLATKPVGAQAVQEKQDAIDSITSRTEV